MKIRSSHIALVISALVLGIIVFKFQWKKSSASQETVVVPATALDDAPGEVEKTTDSTSQESVSVLDDAPDEVEKTTDSTSGEVPSIWVETQDLDLGLIPGDRFFYSDFPIHNRGKKPLRITDIKTSCMCTQGMIATEKRVIAPGESEIMQIKIEPRRIGGFKSTKILTIFSNDPNNPKLSLNVSAHLEPELELVPPAVRFGKIAQGTFPEATILVRQLTDPALLIMGTMEYPGKEPKPDSGDFIYTIERRPEEMWMAPGKLEYELKVKVSPKLDKGKHRRYVWIFLKNHRLRALRVPMYTEVY